MMTGLVARPWFLMEICSKQDIINIVTDASTETTKIGLSPKLGILIIQKKKRLLSFLPHK